MKKLLATILALVMALGLCSVSWAAGTEKIVVHGIKYNNKDDNEFATFEAAYAALKPVVASVCDTSGGTDGLGQESAKSAEAFKSVFTDVDSKGNATITYKISGNVTYDETSCANLLTMGRKASHYNADNQPLHLINFKFIGEDANRGATLTVNSNITLPYEWWGEKVTTSISFENLTITGSAPNGLWATQSYFEALDFRVDNCTVKGLRIYNYNNVGGKYAVTNSTLDGTGTSDATAIHVQGSATESLNINISGNTISGYERGVNVDQNTAQATVSNNTIAVAPGYSCVQISRVGKIEIKDNDLTLNGSNAFTIHRVALETDGTPDISISNNTITGTGYLLYDDVKANGGSLDSGTDTPKIVIKMENNTIPSTVDTTKGVKADKVVANDSQVVSNAVREGITVLQTPPHYYYHPTTDTKADETKGSPKTFDAGVGIYAVTAVLSVTGMAWVGKKRH